ncbi:MAG: acyl-CoA dehydrogenase family protein, partial [Thermoplasmata archaeon]|nr:acyl-CoA dehydrogenase family protein [Thermoplasmata archaeon]
MEFGLTKEQEMVKRTARQFAEKEIAPIAADIDEKAEFPVETIRKLGELGFMGMTVPKEWGGAGMDEISYAIAVEEISRVCASHGVTMAVCNSLVCWPLMKYGTDAHKEKFLRPVASGKSLGCFALTEPNAGTDAGSQTTLAIKKGDDYVINGSKVFITNASKSDVTILFAMTDKSKGTRGITAFVVDSSIPGYSIGS